VKDYSDKYSNKILKEYEKVNNCKTVEQLRSCEGNARKIYFEFLKEFLSEEFSFYKRERKPPTDPINALISFLNMVLYGVCLNQIFKTALNPTISFVHEPSQARYSLALDVADIFKPLFVDKIILTMINRKQIKIEDFDRKLNYCVLLPYAKKKMLTEFHKKLDTSIVYPKMRRKVKYKELILFECYKILKHIIGAEKYKAFRIWW
jgi:CRISPR-associated protein Cas1